MHGEGGFGLCVCVWGFCSELYVGEGCFGDLLVDVFIYAIRLFLLKWLLDLRPSRGDGDRWVWGLFMCRCLTTECCRLTTGL